MKNNPKESPRETLKRGVEAANKALKKAEELFAILEEKIEHLFSLSEQGFTEASKEISEALDFASKQTEAMFSPDERDLERDIGDFEQTLLTLKETLEEAGLKRPGTRDFVEKYRETRQRIIDKYSKHIDRLTPRARKLFKEFKEKTKLED